MGRVRLRRHDRVVVGSLDVGGQMLHRYARNCIVGSALFMVPLFAGQLALSLTAFDRFMDLDRSLPGAFGAAAATGTESVLAYLSRLGSGLTAAIVGAYVTSIVLGHQLGTPARMGTAIRACIRRLPVIVAAWLVGHSWMFATSWFATSTSGGDRVAIFVVGAPFVALLATLVLMVSPILMTERIGPFAALRRSAKLARYRFGTAYWFVCVSFAFGASLQLGISWLPRLAQSTGLVTFGSFGGLAQDLAVQVGQLITVPFVAIATAQFYLQTRVHAEGIDMVIAADRAFGERVL